MTTRRDLLRGAAVAVPAAALSGVTPVAANPDERLAAAAQELRDALLARWLGFEITEWDSLRLTERTNPMIAIVAHPPRKEG